MSRDGNGTLPGKGLLLETHMASNMKETADVI